MMINDDNPNPTIRLKSFKKLEINTFMVTAFNDGTCSLAWSIITIPISGKMKNTIPKIGVTWCEVTVTAIKESEVAR